MRWSASGMVTLYMRSVGKMGGPMKLSRFEADTDTLRERGRERGREGERGKGRGRGRGRGRFCVCVHACARARRSTHPATASPRAAAFPSRGDSHGHRRLGWAAATRMVTGDSDDSNGQRRLGLVIRLRYHVRKLDRDVHPGCPSESPTLFHPDSVSSRYSNQAPDHRMADSCGPTRISDKDSDKG